MGCSPPGSSVHEILQTRILDGLPCLPPGVLPNPGIKSISLVSCSGWWILHHWHHLGSPTCPIEGAQLVSNSWPSLCLSSFIQRENGLPLDKFGRINYVHLAQLPPFTSWKWADHRTQVWPTSFRTVSAVALTSVQCCYDWVDKPSNSELQNLEAQLPANISCIL